MDSEAITLEIVRIRNRLDELDQGLEGGSGTDVDDERQELEERLRHLRGLMSRQGSDESRNNSVAEEVRYIPPA
jgi:hypothetical protein